MVAHCDCYGPCEHDNWGYVPSAEELALAARVRELEAEVRELKRQAAEFVPPAGMKCVINFYRVIHGTPNDECEELGFIRCGDVIRAYRDLDGDARGGGR